MILKCDFIHRKEKSMNFSKSLWRPPRKIDLLPRWHSIFHSLRFKSIRIQSTDIYCTASPQIDGPLIKNQCLSIAINKSIRCRIISEIILIRQVRDNPLIIGDNPDCMAFPIQNLSHGSRSSLRINAILLLVRCKRHSTHDLSFIYRHSLVTSKTSRPFNFQEKLDFTIWNCVVFYNFSLSVLREFRSVWKSKKIERRKFD